MQNCLIINTNKNPLITSLYKNELNDFDDDGDWGQFIDIECLHLFPKQILHTTETTTTTKKTDITTTDTITKTVTTTTTTTNTKTFVLKSILKKPKEFDTIPESDKKTHRNKYENDEEYNYYKDDDEPDVYTKYDKKSRLLEFVERQLYVGCLICVLTVGFYFIPE